MPMVGIGMEAVMRAASGSVIASSTIANAPASETPLNLPLGPHRRFDWLAFDLEEVKRVKRALGGTVNDVALATVAGATTRFLERRGISMREQQELDFRAACPVNTRPDADRGRLGNRVSELVVRMPLGGLRVHGGPEARTALDQLGARAAQRGTDLAFAEDDPDFATVAHEVAHALQAAPGGRGIAAADSRAEHEADAFAHALEGSTAPVAASGHGLDAASSAAHPALGLSPSPSASHLLRIRRLARGSAAIWWRESTSTKP